MSLKPRDPDFAKRVAAAFANQGFMTTIGARLGAVEAGSVEIRVGVHPAISQQDGYVHGGVVAAIADSAAGFAAFSLMPAGSAVLTAEFKINFLAPAAGEALIARGRVIKPGRQLFVCAAEVAARRSDGETPIAAAQLTMMHVPDAANG